jgi:hypothetical protein
VKIIERNILPFQENDIFSPMRDKAGYAKLLALSARALLLENNLREDVTSCFKLIIDKMNRLFFYTQNKYFSVSFPFSVILDEDEQITINTYSGKEFDFKSISAVLAILQSDQYKINTSLIDFYIEPGSIDADGLFILEEIFQFEPSYVRYDHDPENENGKLHPLHHLDINYSTYGTFKLGLNNAITNLYFENIHNTNTDCSFVID